MNINILTHLILIKNTFECVMKSIGKGKEHILKKSKRQSEDGKQVPEGTQKEPTAWISQNVMSLVWRTKFI